LFHRVHRKPGRLLAVTERGVEDDDAVHGLVPLSFLACYGWSLVGASAGVAVGACPTISRRIGPGTASPPKTRTGNTSCFVATIMPARTTMSSVWTGGRFAQSNSLKLQ